MAARKNKKKYITLQDFKPIIQSTPRPATTKVRLRVTDSDGGVTILFAEHITVTWDADEGEYLVVLEADASRALPRRLRGGRSPDRRS